MTNNKKNKKAARLGDVFGGLLGKTVKNLRSGGVANNQKGKKKRTRKQFLDSL